MWYEIKIRNYFFADNENFKFIFKENRVFIEEEGNPSEKVVIVEEELDGIG